MDIGSSSEGFTHKLKLLDDLGRFVNAQYRPRCGDPEARVGGREGLETGETCVGCNQGPVEGAEAVHVLRGVLEHPVPRPGVRDGVDGERLEPPPAEREDKGVARFDCEKN